MIQNPFNDEDGDGEGLNTIWRDATLNPLGFLLVIVVILLLFINPKAKKAQEDIVPPGNVIVETTWPDDRDADVDTWCQAPGDVPVGYSNQGGVIFNLLRDDLGKNVDASDINAEQCISRGIVPGEYTVNVHLYSDRTLVYPLPVNVVISVKPSMKESAKQILKTKVMLHYITEEITAFRFRLTEDGKLVPGSVHALFKPLRAAR
ncbi:MAG TPA: hypothetical protein VJB70_02665 [Candidatus Paceibacterota bacterium]